jgi:hypothetical protein
MLPGRAGADTRIEAIVALGQLREMPGGTACEQAWLAAVAGQPGYLAGTNAQVAACDALVFPVVTGCPDLSVADQMIEVLLDFLQAAAGTGSFPGGLDPAAARERSKALRARGLAGPAPRDREAGRRPGVRPGPARLHLAPRPARSAL